MSTIKKIKISHLIIHLVLIVIAAVVLLPIVYTIASSFKTNQELMAHPERLFPHEPTMSNYITAWNSSNFNVGRMLLNSIGYTVWCVAVGLFTSSTSGYVFARGNFKGKKIVFGVFSALMFINIVGVGVYPLFEVLKVVGLTSSLPALMLTKIFGIPVVNMYLVRGYVNSLPKELDEAAKIDGCGFIGIFFRIILPLLVPIMATVAILLFNHSWNDFMMPTIFTLNYPMQRTLIVGVTSLKNSSGAASQWNLMLAGSTIALVPVIMAYIFCNKYIVAGMAAGAVKG